MSHACPLTSASAELCSTWCVLVRHLLTGLASEAVLDHIGRRQDRAVASLRRRAGSRVRHAVRLIHLALVLRERALLRLRGAFPEAPIRIAPDWQRRASATAGHRRLVWCLSSAILCGGSADRFSAPASSRRSVRETDVTDCLHAIRLSHGIASDMSASLAVS